MAIIKLLSFREFANIHPDYRDAKNGDHFFIWMERNWDSIRHYEFISYPHAGIVFSSIITEFCKEISNGDATKIPMIISWLMENKQSPFGLILKVKAYRTLLKRLDMLNWDDYKKLTGLQITANEMKYRPREFLYLDKLLIKLHTALTQKP